MLSERRVRVRKAKCIVECIKRGICLALLRWWLSNHFPRRLINNQKKNFSTRLSMCRLLFVMFHSLIRPREQRFSSFQTTATIIVPQSHCPVQLGSYTLTLYENNIKCNWLTKTKLGLSSQLQFILTNNHKIHSLSIPHLRNYSDPRRSPTTNVHNNFDGHRIVIKTRWISGPKINRVNREQGHVQRRETIYWRPHTTWEEQQYRHNHLSAATLHVVSY